MILKGTYTSTLANDNRIGLLRVLLHYLLLETCSVIIFFLLLNMFISVYIYENTCIRHTYTHSFDIYMTIHTDVDSVLVIIESMGVFNMWV
jgi:hypothetical protein